MGTLAPLGAGDAGAPIAGDIFGTVLGTLAPPIPEWDHKSGPPLWGPPKKNKLTTAGTMCKLTYMGIKQPITDVLRSTLQRAIANGETFKGLERNTGVLRQTMMTFARGTGVLRGDAADKLAAYFGLELRPKRKKG